MSCVGKCGITYIYIYKYIFQLILYIYMSYIYIVIIGWFHPVFLFDKTSRSDPDPQAVKSLPHSVRLWIDAANRETDARLHPASGRFGQGGKARRFLERSVFFFPKFGWIYDFMMMLWWFHDDFMMILWWFYDDVMMISWWFYDDFMMILWWFYDDFMMIYARRNIKEANKHVHCCPKFRHYAIWEVQIQIRTLCRTCKRKGGCCGRCLLMKIGMNDRWVHSFETSPDVVPDFAWVIKCPHWTSPNH